MKILQSYIQIFIFKVALKFTNHILKFTNHIFIFRWRKEMISWQRAFKGKHPAPGHPWIRPSAAYAQMHKANCQRTRMYVLFLPSLGKRSTIYCILLQPLSPWPSLLSSNTFKYMPSPLERMEGSYD